mgnify:FL=1
MPYYRQADGAPTTLCVGDDAWLIDGLEKLPAIPAAEALVADGSWERSDRPFKAPKAVEPAGNGGKKKG